MVHRRWISIILSTYLIDMVHVVEYADDIEDCLPSICQLSCHQFIQINEHGDNIPLGQMVEIGEDLVITDIHVEHIEQCHIDDLI